METLSAFVRFTKEELKDLLTNLDQCYSEGYISYGDPAMDAWAKLQLCYDNFDEKNGE